MSTDKKRMDWMYGDAKSLIDREKYLLGQKVDKNFDLFSKAASNEKSTGLDAILESRASSASKSGFKSVKGEEKERSNNLLKLGHVKQYDPLMQIKMKEENLKTQLLNNPVKMAKLQGIIKEEMQKKMHKILKKKMKKEKKKLKKQEKSNARSRSSSNSSMEKQTSQSTILHRQVWSSNDDQTDNREQSTSNLPISPDSDCDEKHMKDKWKGYGLITKRKQNDEKKEHKKYESKYGERAPINVPWRRPHLKDQLKHKRKRENLTEEEKKKRLDEMMNTNVNWRKEQREMTIKRIALADKKLEELDRKSRRQCESVNLVQQAHISGQSDSLEDRLKRQKGRLQKNIQEF